MNRVFEYRTLLRTASVGVIRNLLAAQVVQAGIILDKDQAYALRLGSSELIDNAIKYSGADRACRGAELLIEGDVDHDCKRLRITVTDPGVAVPKMLGCDDLSATGGRGLMVVAGYADDFGWYQRLDGGVPVGWSVWFELDVQELPFFGQATAEAEVQPEDPVSALPRLRTLKTFAFTRRRQIALGRPLSRGRERRAA